MFNLSKVIKVFVALFSMALLAACGGKNVVLPLKVQSDPLGAHVIYQIQSNDAEQATADWIYLGSTPISSRKNVKTKQLDSKNTLVIKVLKEGYLNQEKAWSLTDVRKEAKDKGTVFWNPRLVPAK